MSTEIIKILDAICDKFGIAINWTLQNTMPYLEQMGEHIINYELYSSILYILIAILSIIVTIGIHKTYRDIDGLGIPVIIYIIATIVICKQFFDIVTVNTFPEKTILDFITIYTQN